MPTLPLPPGDVPISGDLPVSDGADVLRVFPRPHKNPQSAPVRDAFCEAFAAGFLKYQLEAEAAAAQCDPTRASGDYLRSLAAEREIAPVAGESDADLRARFFQAPAIVTPDNILAAINQFLAPLTSKKAEICELELDGMFVHDGTAVWDCFIGANPHYQDRLFEDDAAENDGMFLEQNNPGGAIPSQGIPRSFLVRVPVLEPEANVDFAFAIDSTDEIMPIGDGTDASGSESDGSDATSVFADSQTSDDLYNAIIGKLESIKGQGIAWTLLVDASL